MFLLEMQLMLMLGLCLWRKVNDKHYRLLNNQLALKCYSYLTPYVIFLYVKSLYFLHQNAKYYVYYMYIYVFKMLWDLYKIFFLSAVQLQEQVSATQNKEFDPLGPLPHGWGKIF